MWTKCNVSKFNLWGINLQYQFKLMSPDLLRNLPDFFFYGLGIFL